MGWNADFCDGIVYCDICNKPMKGHIDEILTKGESGPSILNKECWKSTAIFMGDRWHRYNKDDGTINTNFSSYCDDDEEE